MSSALFIMLSVSCAADAPEAAKSPSTESVQEETSLTFAVLGHVRGDPPTDGILNYLIDEVIADVNAQQPDFVVLAGDMIYGDCHSTPADARTVTAEWDALDAKLRELDAKVYRVPGNHDIHDLVTRDIYYQRYGQPPRVINIGKTRLLLLNSCWVRSDEYQGPKKGVRGWPIGSDQIQFIKAVLSDTENYDHAFVFVHHLLWWKPDAPWWRDVHPLLVDRKVRAVFSGDLGPYKYSHKRQDGIDYLQCSIENKPQVSMMRYFESSRLLSQLMDCYLLVRVTGDNVDIELRPVGALTSGNYSPQRWAELYDYQPWYAVYYHKALRRYPVAMIACAAASGGCLGLICGWWLMRRRRSAADAA